MTEKPIIMPDLALHLQPVKPYQLIKGVKFAPEIKFNKILFTGPPGCGKTTMCTHLGAWPDEGYINLSYPGWWKASPLALRPREIHLGFPFIGIKNALTAFEPEWIKDWNQLELDFERIYTPPVKRFILSVNWHTRFSFEFLLPTAELLLSIRQKRAQTGAHHIDRHLDLQQIRKQVKLHAQVAKSLHDAGLIVHIRNTPESIPCRIVTESASTNA